jgi:hypothetical protein
LVNSFGEVDLSALSPLRESVTFSRFSATVRAWRADHKLNFFVPKTSLRVLFTNLRLALGEAIMSCLEVENVSFSTFDIAFALSEGAVQVWQR